MANEPEDLGAPSPVSGYEADTNGETDKEAVEESVDGDGVEPDKIAAYGSPDETSDDVLDEQEAADRLAAYGSPDDLLDEVVEDEDVTNIQPKTNGHAVAAHGLADRMDDLDREENLISHDGT